MHKHVVRKKATRERSRGKEREREDIPISFGCAHLNLT
jgi:hypothetical protein